MPADSLHRIKLEVIAITGPYTHHNNYCLLLSEVGGIRRLPVMIGLSEAQSIAVRLENMQSSRPLTHDLFFSFAMSLGARVTEVLIYDLREGIFYSKLICSNGSTTVEVDARTSDAVSIALRFDCPVYTFSHVFERAGVLVGDAPDEQKATARPTSLEDLDSKELRERMAQAISDEDYELASRIRDMLRRRAEGDDVAMGNI